MGPVTSRGLEPGEFRHLTPHEVRALAGGASPRARGRARVEARARRRAGPPRRPPRGLDRYEPGKPIEQVQRELGLRRRREAGVEREPAGPLAAGARGGPARLWPRSIATRTARRSRCGRPSRATRACRRAGRGRQRLDRAHRPRWRAPTSAPGTTPSISEQAFARFRQCVSARNGGARLVPMRELHPRPRGDGRGRRRPHPARLRGEPEQPHRDLERRARGRGARRRACRRGCSWCSTRPTSSTPRRPRLSERRSTTSAPARPSWCCGRSRRSTASPGCAWATRWRRPEVLEASTRPRAVQHELARPGRRPRRPRRPRARAARRSSSTASRRQRLERSSPRAASRAAEPRQLPLRRLRREAAAVFRSLLAQRRDRAAARGLRLPTRLRVSVGTADENDVFLAALDAALRAQSPRASAASSSPSTDPRGRGSPPRAGPSPRGSATSSSTPARCTGPWPSRRCAPGVSLDDGEALAALAHGHAHRARRRRPARAPRRRGRHGRDPHARGEPRGSRGSRCTPACAARWWRASASWGARAASCWTAATSARPCSPTPT